MKSYVAEFIGTFALVFCGTGAIVVNQELHGVIGHQGIAMTFGLIVLAMIYTFGETSGAHFNPAVSVGFWVAGRFNKKLVLPYIASQAAGAFAATLAIKFLFPSNATLGSTMPSGSDAQSFAMEFVLTYLLMLVILHVSQGSKEIGVLAGIAVGATVGLEAMFAGPVSGASMNPARSLAPAMVSGNLQSLWLYMLAPVVGAAVAALTWRWMRSK